MPIDKFCYHGDDKKEWCNHCNSPKSNISFGAVKPSLNPHLVAEQLGASEVIELPEHVTRDPTGRAAIDYVMESRGYKRIA